MHPHPFDKQKTVGATVDTRYAPTTFEKETNIALRAMYQITYLRVNTALKIMSNALPKTEHYAQHPDMVATLFHIQKMLIPSRQSSEILRGHLKQQLRNFEYMIGALEEIQEQIKSIRLYTHKDDTIFPKLFSLEQQLFRILEHSGTRFYEKAKALKYDLYCPFTPSSDEAREAYEEKIRQESAKSLAEHRDTTLSEYTSLINNVKTNGDAVIKTVSSYGFPAEEILPQTRLEGTRNTHLISAYSALHTSIQELVRMDTSQIPKAMMVRPDGIDLHDALHMILLEMNDLMAKCHLSYTETPMRTKKPLNAGRSRVTS